MARIERYAAPLTVSSCRSFIPANICQFMRSVHPVRHCRRATSATLKRRAAIATSLTKTVRRGCSRARSRRVKIHPKSLRNSDAGFTGSLSAPALHPCHPNENARLLAKAGVAVAGARYADNLFERAC
jgi:hypothetical protein